ncbi:MAG: hypothetical protein Q8L81_18595 [Bacteroidota bacterium]|nr:hypothetical protein [Bacteroidota bacterium]
MKLAKLKNETIVKMNTAIQNKSEELITVLLKKNGYDSVGKEGRFIIADSALRKMLLLVIAVQHPSALVQPSSTDIVTLKRKAIELKREAWVALVSIKDGEIFGLIQWKNHSK